MDRKPRFETPPSVVRVWMPSLMCIGIFLFLQHMAPIYWLGGVPVVALAMFMTTLAAVHDDGRQTYVKRWWAAPRRIPGKDVLGNDESALEGIGRLRLRRFVLPWGRIYFVREWSVTGKEKETARPWRVL